MVGRRSSDAVRVGVWGPAPSRAPRKPGLRHVTAGIVLGVFVLPLGYLTLLSLPSSVSMVNQDDVAATSTGPVGLLLGLMALWAGLLIGVLMAMRASRRTFRDLTGWGFRWRDPLLGVAFVAFFLLLNVLAVWALSLFGVELSQGMGNSGTFTDLVGPVALKVAIILGATLVAPVVEEIFFRGLLLGVLMDKGPTWLAVVGSSLVFGLMHVQGDLTASLYTVSATALVGAGLAVLRLRTGRLGASICGHVLFNSVNLALAFLGI